MSVCVRCVCMHAHVHVCLCACVCTRVYGVECVGVHEWLRVCVCVCMFMGCVLVRVCTSAVVVGSCIHTCLCECALATFCGHTWVALHAHGVSSCASTGHLPSIRHNSRDRDVWRFPWRGGSSGGARGRLEQEEAFVGGKGGR